MGGKSQIYQQRVHVEANLIYNSMNCKKGVFVTIRHNDSRDFTAKISEVCQNTKIEPRLVPLSSEDLSNRTANRSNEERLDVRACGFWERGQQAFFDLRVFDPNACQYLNKLQQHCHAINENEKKRAYNERVLQVEHDIFMPLVFSIYRSMGTECHNFFSRLSDLLSEKRNLPKSVVTKWVRSKVCFALLKSSLLCLHGSQAVFRKTSKLEFVVDISHDLAKIYKLSTFAIKSKN